MLTYIYFEVKVWITLSHALKSNSLGDIRQNHWTMKYMSHRPTFILKSNVGSHWLIIPQYDVTQNPWTMKYRSQRPIFILRSNVITYWLNIQNYDVHTSNNLHDIRHNHRTVKYRSCWPSLHDLLSAGWFNSKKTRKKTSGHTDSWSQIMMFIHQIVFKVLGKITGPWNIGHNDLHLCLVKCHNILTHYPKLWCSYIK